MNVLFNKVRKDMLATLAKYPMKAIPEEEYEKLINQYGEENMIESLRFLISKGMVDPKALGATNEGIFIDSEYLALTADGYTIATDDELGYKIDSVTIKIHAETVNQLSSIINASNLKEDEKKTLLSKLKEKGAEHILTRCIDLGFSSAKIAGLLLIEYLKNPID